MPFIGVFARENDSNFIKNEIKKNAIMNKYEVIIINSKSLENLKNVKFDILIIKEDISYLIEESNYIDYLINNANYLIVNTDINNNILKQRDNIITYGFNTNSDISVSSIKDDNIMICVQKKIKGINEKIIEEQEVIIKVKKHNINKLYNIMVIFTVLIIYGERLKNN